MLSTGTAIQTISAAALRELRVPRMTPDEMRRIAERCREIEKDLRDAKEKEKAAKEARASLFD